MVANRWEAQLVDELVVVSLWLEDVLVAVLVAWLVDELVAELEALLVV